MVGYRSVGAAGFRGAIAAAGAHSNSGET